MIDGSVDDEGHQVIRLYGRETRLYDVLAVIEQPCLGFGNPLNVESSDRFTDVILPRFQSNTPLCWATLIGGMVGVLVPTLRLQDVSDYFLDHLFLGVGSAGSVGSVGSVGGVCFRGAR